MTQDYIAEIRALIGHRPIFLVGAAVLLLDEADRVLLNLRPDNGCWGIPGGALEPGEELVDAARRETREETGLEVEDLELFEVFSGPELFYEYPNGDQVYNVTVVYTCYRWHGDLTLTAESQELRFFPVDQLPSNISPPVIPVLKKLSWLLGIESPPGA